MSQFKRLLTISSLTQLADEVVSAKVILPWIFLFLSAPVWMMSLIVPIRESGALLPQWSVKGHLRSSFSTGTIWRVGMVIQGMSVGLIVLAIVLPLIGASYWALAGVIFLSLGRALCSFTIKDIQAHNIPKGDRGKLIGLGGSIAGIITVIVSGCLLVLTDLAPKDWILLLLTLSGVLCYFIAVSISLRLPMPSGLQAKESPSLFSFWQQHSLLRKIVYQRMAVLHGLLAMPYMVLALSDKPSSTLPWFMLSAALASFAASGIWGWLADSSARNTMFRATLMTMFGVLAFYVGLMWQYELWWMMGAFIVANLGYAGVRTARKTYLIDVTEQAERQSYVASGNTLVGLGLLGLGGLYAVLYPYVQAHMLIVCMAMLAIGLWVTSAMPQEK